jgi:aminoglycoside phosphotransferase (APT) family kinase protein
VTRPPNDAVREALGRLLPDLGPRATVRFRPLEGGINRRSFLVESEGARWVLRLRAAGAAALLDVATEAHVMRAAAAAGLAPAVVAADADSGLLLTEYRPRARAWTAEEARSPPNLVRAAALLRALHSVQADIPAYAAERIARGYLDALAAHAAPELVHLGGARSGAWGEELLELAHEFDARYPSAGLCHNDLVAANVLDEGKLLLVDFEYAVRGPPLLDLAGLAGMNDFIPQQRRDLLEAYHGTPRSGSVAARAGVLTAPEPELTERDLERAIRMVRLMSFFWARLGAQRSAEAVPYSRLAITLANLLE